MTDLQLKLKLLELEVTALLSVLSEYYENKSCYSQWVKAETIRSLLYMLKEAQDE